MQHAFGAPGAFNVTVTATDSVGNATTQVGPVLVAPPPPPRIDSPVSVKWGRQGKFVYLVAMRVVRPPQGTPTGKPRCLPIGSTAPRKTC